MDDELSKRGIEGAVGKRERLRGGEPDVDAGMALASGTDKGVGRVDRGDLLGANATNELRGERTGSTADVENTLTGSNAGEVGKLRREQPRPGSHESVVRLSGHIEAHAADLGVRAESRVIGCGRGGCASTPSLRADEQSDGYR